MAASVSVRGITSNRAMQKIVRVPEVPSPCVLKKVRRSRHIRISVRQDGRVVVTAPYYETYAQMERFLYERRDWVVKKMRELSRSPARVHPGGSHAHYRQHKENARAFVFQRLGHYCRIYGVRYRCVSIRNQKTRWGSCSQKGSLSFNYKIMFLPQEQADYIIVHELCHLKELNHSVRFWDIVSRTIPNYAAIRRKLRKLVA